MKVLNFPVNRISDSYKWNIAPRCVCLTLATPWTVDHQAMGFPRQEWSGLPFPSPGDHPNLEIKPGLLHCKQSLSLQTDSLPTEPLWKLICARGASFFLNKFIYFNWRLITLQYCNGFCHTLIWISHGFTCIPHPEPSLPIPSLWVIPVHFLIGLFVFLELSCMTCLYISEIKSLSVALFAIIFSHSEGCLVPPCL